MLLIRYAALAVVLGLAFAAGLALRSLEWGCWP